MLDFAFDALRVGHMLAFAVGIGTAAFLGLQVFGRFRRCVDLMGLRIVLYGNMLIRKALAALWITGVGLLAMQIGVLGGTLTEQHAVKFLIVAVLTASAWATDRYLIPELFVYEGAEPSEIPALMRIQLGAAAGLSGGCWISALLLGGTGLMKSMPAEQIAALFVPVVLAATLAAAAAAWSAGRGPMRIAGHVVPGE